MDPLPLTKMRRTDRNPVVPIRVTAPYVQLQGFFAIANKTRAVSTSSGMRNGIWLNLRILPASVDRRVANDAAIGVRLTCKVLLRRDKRIWSPLLLDRRDTIGPPSLVDIYLRGAGRSRYTLLRSRRRTRSRPQEHQE
jgi:hypothetical protein